MELRHLPSAGGGSPPALSLESHTLSDVAPRLAPRSVAAAADFELLRVARTDLDGPETVATLSLVGRLRELAAFRSPRQSGGGPGAIVRPSHRER